MYAFGLKLASCFAQCFGQFQLKGIKTKTDHFIRFPKCLICQRTWMQTMIKTLRKYYHQGAPIEFHVPYLLSKAGKTRRDFLRIVWSRTHAAFGWSGLLAARLEFAVRRLVVALANISGRFRQRLDFKKMNEVLTIDLCTISLQHGPAQSTDNWLMACVLVGFNVFLSFTNRVTGARVNIYLFASCCFNLIDWDTVIQGRFQKKTTDFLMEESYLVHLSCQKLVLVEELRPTTWDV